MPTAPELLAPAGSLDAVRAAVANGANSVYLGASRFNARDEGAQLSLDELATACQIAHAGGVRVYMTLNTLVKPAELGDCLTYLGECIDRGIDAAIVQDVGLVRLIQAVYPGFEIHGSTQMTVHDESGARVTRRLGVERVVLARENTLDDIRAIRSAVPDLGLETFVHGALCIAYSGQCFMSGMISERSANRGSCAQSCRKDYLLADLDSGQELDRGYLISAKDLGAYDHLAEIADAGVGCLKIEGRKKKPEYVATVTRGYREWLDRVERGTFAPPTFEETRPLVQIFSRGFTGGMYGGRAGREYITRTQPDNHGLELGVVTGYENGELLVDVTSPINVGDGLGFEPPAGGHAESTGFAVGAVRTVHRHGALLRQAVTARSRVPLGWRVFRTSDLQLLEHARASFAALADAGRIPRVMLDVRVFGTAGAPLKAMFDADGAQVTQLSGATLAPATRRALGAAQLREQFGRLGETPFELRDVDGSGLAANLFLPVSELNRMRQRATDELLVQRDWARRAVLAERGERIRAVVALPAAVTTPVSRTAPAAAANAASATSAASATTSPPFTLAAEVFNLDDASAAAAAGATEIVFDPFLRHPAPSRARIRALAAELEGRGITLRLRTPSIVRPEERRALQKWLDVGLPLLSGHLGLIAELGAGGRDVTADYSVNCFNAHTAREYFALGARRITASIELTTDEITQLVSTWNGEGFDVLLYGRPEGMILEHCVLSAAFDREVTTCRDLCVQKHPNVALTDPTGYQFPVATDSACRNRLLHSRPIDGAQYLPRLWRGGVRGYRTVFNVRGADVSAIIRAYRQMLDALVAGESPAVDAVRTVLGDQYTRGHFARAV
jgi:putative protease